jgi:hypothetical protein
MGTEPEITESVATIHHWTASELRKTPPEVRDAVLREAAALAEAEYRNHPELTAFNAFGDNHLFCESTTDN